MSFDIGLENDDLPEDPRLITGTPFVVQQISEVTTLFLGEWYLDRREGIDWIAVLQEPDPDTQATLAVLEREIGRIDGVIRTQNGNVVFDEQAQRLSFELEVVTLDEEAITVSVQETETRDSNGMPFAVFFRSNRIDGRV